MTCAEQIADFVAKANYGAISDTARFALKIRVLDSLGCSIAATGSNMLQAIRAHIEEFGGARLCSLIRGGKTAPDRAAFYNSALVRYLDFNDSYLAKNETCHPSDNLGAVLAACEYADRTGTEFLTALAIAYQIQCRLSDAAPVRDKGFDHTTQGSYASQRVFQRRWPGSRQNGSCPCNLRDGFECAPRHANRGTLQLERVGLPKHCFLRYARDTPCDAWHYRSVRSLRGQQRVHGCDFRLVPNRLVERGPGARHTNDREALQRGNPFPVRH